MKKFRMTGPSGPMETMAPTKAKAWSNLRYRLACECGLGWYRASQWDHSDLHEVS